MTSNQNIIEIRKEFANEEMTCSATTRQHCTNSAPSIVTGRDKLYYTPRRISVTLKTYTLCKFLLK